MGNLLAAGCTFWLLAGPLVPALAQATTPAPAAVPAPRKPSYLRLGLGTTYDFAGYYRCTRVSAEWAPMLTRRLGLASRLVGVAGKPDDSYERQAPHQNYKAAHVEQEAIFYPFGADKRIVFGVGGGGFVGYYKKNSFDYLQFTDGKLVDYRLASWEGTHAGYLLSLNLEVALGAERRWRVGLKSTLQNGINGNTTSPSSNLTLARRL